MISVEKSLEHWQFGALLCFMNVGNIIESISSLLCNLSLDLVFLSRIEGSSEISYTTCNEITILVRSLCVDTLLLCGREFGPF